MDQPKIRTPDQRVRVFVSSTMNELAAERVAARRAIERLRLIPVLFELGARPYPPRELYLAYLRQSNVFVAVYGQQYGWVAPGRDVSGLEDEYLAAGGMPKLIYIQPSTPQRDPRLAAMIERIGQEGLSYRVFRGTRELQTLLADDLAVLLSERFDATPSYPQAAGPRRVVHPASNQFVGRREEMRRLTALLTDDGVPLVTLVGPGGIGKTRLALELGKALRDRFDEVVLAELENVTVPEAVPGILATALGLPDSAGSPPMERAARLLAARRVLLIVDNVEQVIAAAPILGRLADAAESGSTLLVTSRERLRLSSETVVEVGPLSLEPPGDGVSGSEAVQLFVDRMVAKGGHRPLDVREYRTVAEICHRLDGLPLAIELAAARARTLGVDELLHRLSGGLDVLAGGARDLPDRQRTLRSTIAWSADLLAPHEHALFAELSTFSGSFSLAAAEAICADDDDPAVLEAVASLVDKSLLRVLDPVHGQARFAMLQVIRRYAAEQVDAARADVLRQRHADYFEAVSQALTVRLRSGGRESLESYTADEENLRAAMRWALERRDSGRLARMGGALWPFWWIHSSFREAIDAMREALQHEEELTGHERLLASLVLGLMAFGHGEEAQAVPYLQTAAASPHAQPREVATARIPLGLVLSEQGDDSGVDLLRRAVEEFRALDDGWGLTFALFSLGGALVLLDRDPEALDPLRESVELAERLEADVFLSNALVNLGWALLRTGNAEEAREALLESLDHAARTTSRDSLARGLDALASLALTVDEPRHGATLLGAADAVRAAVGGGVWPTDRGSTAHTSEGIRAALPSEAYTEAYRQGTQLTVEGALETARAV